MQLFYFNFIDGIVTDFGLKLFTIIIDFVQRYYFKIILFILILNQLKYFIKKGGDFDQRFKKLKKENVRLSEEQVLDWTVQLLSAVNYMHSRRVLHRDLKARYACVIVL